VFALRGGLVVVPLWNVGGGFDLRLRLEVWGCR
jgi:hypothetical protein